ncbi:hypothetical protein EBR21_07280, partial [bacterium]|nr:hypothetical protein [bacterium]
AAAWLVSRFPWPVFHADFSSTRDSTFIENWPLPALEEDRQERKKLRRFPKSEQQRRLGIIMRRMEFLNIPLFDFFLDQGVQIISPELPVGSAQATPLIWPAMKSRRKIGTEETSFRDLSYVVLPSSFGAQCVEGINIFGGEEIRIGLPPAKNKRNIVFNVLPLTPSNLRAWLGQFSWARQFNDSDVNRMQSISIPVNDPAATTLRLSMGSGSLLLTSAFVAQWDRSGRVPVQVGSQSLVWRSANEKVAADNQDEGDSLPDDGTEELAGGPSANAQGTPAAAQATPPATTTQTTTQATTQVVMQATPSSKQMETADASQKTGKVALAEDLLDPETVKYNQVLGVSGPSSVALGYNVALIQLDPVMNDVFADETMFAALAPRLYAFVKQSLNLQVQFPSTASAAELFQHTIVRQNGELIPVDLPILMRDLISGTGVFNLYQDFRNFGYKVASFANPRALSLPGALAFGTEIPKIEGRWLDSNDWNFLARRKQLDQQNEPVTGLEAIFKSEQSAIVQSVSDGDFSKMSEMLEGLELESDSIPDWRANEIAVINSRKVYLPRLVDGFQKWMKENSQSRFLAHLYLNNEDQSFRPSFKDFLKVLKYKKIKSIAFPGVADRWARLVMLDRVFGNLIDTLVARRTHHRTAVAVLLPSRADSRKPAPGRVLINVPGLLSRKFSPEKPLNFDDALATIAQTVGVQLSNLDSEGRLIFKGRGIEKEAIKAKPDALATVVVAADKEPAKVVNAEQAKTSAQGRPQQEVIESSLLQQSVGSLLPMQQVSRFRMIVLPRAAGCQPFEWAASSNYFGLESSQPIVEEPAPRGRVIRVFPCGLRDQVIELSWFQSHAGADQASFSAVNLPQWLGGHFRLYSSMKSAEAGDAPMFLVGPQALPFDSLPLRLQKFSSGEVPQLFDFANKQSPERETLARVLNFSSQVHGPQMSARTLVYFFREPVRR